MKNEAVTQKEHEAANHGVKKNVRTEEKNNIYDLAQQVEDVARKKNYLSHKEAQRHNSNN